jgi:hypothetical protein
VLGALDEVVMNGCTHGELCDESEWKRAFGADRIRHMPVAMAWKHHRIVIGAMGQRSEYRKPGPDDMHSWKWDGASDSGGNTERI